MRVTNKMMYTNYSFNLMNTEASLQKLSNQISTGQRIQLPSDDPIGTARAMSFRTSITEINQYVDNSNQGVSWLNSGDDALMTLDDNLQRVRELVIAGANDTLTTESRLSLATEVGQIRDGIMQIANTNIDDRYIFAGDKVLQPPYVMRTTVSGDNLNLEVKPIIIDSRNNQIQVKLDDQKIVTLNLTTKTYDGSLGNTLDDLAADIETKLRGIGFDVPVHVKLNNDNQIEFYAGKQPSDGVNHTLVLKDGPAIKATGTARPPFAANQLMIDVNSNPANNYYNGWTVTITKGTGAGQTRTITGYAGGTQQITGLSNPWNPNAIPDATSEYLITPPMEGRATLNSAGNTVTLPGPASDIAGFYTGMDITFYDDSGKVIDSQKVTGYNAAHQITVTNNFPVNGVYNYTITPHLSGTAQPGAAGQLIRLDTTGTGTAAGGASPIDHFYDGASITATYIDGTSETKKITSYIAGVAQVDSPWKNDPSTSPSVVKYEVYDTALSQLGFENKATTKQLLGTELKSPVLIMGRYPVIGTATAGTVNSIDLDSAGSAPNYYANWTVTVTGNPGADPTPRTITGVAGTTASVIPPWSVAPGAGSTYTLNPPLIGTVNAGAVPNNQIKLAAASSTVQNFYAGMPLTITDGMGKSQTRIINAYDPVTQIATLDSPWGTPPDTTSSYAIDASSYLNSNNKFKIKVGIEMTKEISLDGGSYTPAGLAKMVESKIQALGGQCANVRVFVTANNQLKIVPQDPDLDNQDAPLSIQLSSGSTADVLSVLGFTDGVRSETGVPNYEGDKGSIEYEVNVGVKLQVNTVGDNLFDPIFKHLNKICLDLRNSNTTALSEDDLADIRKDIDWTLVKQGEIGAKVNRLEKSVDRFNSLSENVTKLLSGVEDTDLTKAVVDLNMKQTAYQAALQSGAKILPMSLLDYLK